MTITSSGLVSKFLPHCHSSSSSDVGLQNFLSSLRTTGNVMRKLLLETPESVKCHLPVRRNLLKRVTEKRRRGRGYPTCTATCAREYVIPLPTVDESKRGLILLDDTFTPSGKRVVSIASKIILHALNQPHRYLFLDGTFKVAPKYFCQVWIVHGFILDSAEVAPLAYFLLEDQTKISYLTVINMLKQHCPHISLEAAVVNFEQAEHQAIRDGFPNARIQGCLFHCKQCLLRHFDKIPTYRNDVSVRENLHSIFALAFIPEDDVVASWVELKPLLSVNPSLLPILDYVESTWIFNNIYPIHM